ncbi:MAG: diguanylate cyclase [Gammaproteobacteria bacterium]
MVAELRTAGDKAQVLRDYSALLRVLLPGLRGIYCHGRDRSVIWSEEPNPPVVLNDAYASALHTVCRREQATPVRVDLDDAVAYLLPMRNEKSEKLGALVIIVDTGHAQLTAVDCAAKLQPATRTLERELSLRLRLVEGYRKLGVQAAEERLLHEVEKAVQGMPDCETTLQLILRLCHKLLQVQTAAILIPDKNMLHLQGKEISRAQLESLAASAVADAAREDAEYCVSMLPGHAESPAGALVLAGWQGPDFSLRRRSRVARFVAAHIAIVLERTYDSLTGLTAWPAFEKELAVTESAMASDETTPRTLMYFDIDRLNVANDTVGREVGDRVLTSFAQILRDELAGHRISRVGGDRFAALLTEGGLEAGREIGERVAARFKLLEFGHGERSYRASVSVGVGSLSDRGELRSEQGPLATAQVACDAAKDRGRGRVEIYQPADLSIIQRFDDIHLVGYIRNAIELGRLALMGQPIVPVKADTAQHGYYEVLVRLLDDDDSPHFSQRVPLGCRALPAHGRTGSLGGGQYSGNAGSKCSGAEHRRYPLCD